MRHILYILLTSSLWLSVVSANQLPQIVGNSLFYKINYTQCLWFIPSSFTIFEDAPRKLRMEPTLEHISDSRLISFGPSSYFKNDNPKDFTSKDSTQRKSLLSSLKENYQIIQIGKEFSVFQGELKSVDATYFRVDYRNKKLIDKKEHIPKSVLFLAFTPKFFWHLFNICQASYKPDPLDDKPPNKRYRVDYYCLDKEEKDCKTEVRDINDPLPEQLQPSKPSH